MSSLFNLATVTAAGGHRLRAGYRIDRSVRFRSSASASFSRTPAGAGSVTTWTWSAWVKRGSLGGSNALFGVSNNSDKIWFSSDQLSFYIGAGAAYTWWSAALFRDPSAWYHIVVVLDTTNATSTDRVRVYVNGVRATANAGSTTYPTQNYSSCNFNTAVSTNIGRADNSNNYYYDGYLTEVNFIDGQALNSSSFGETNPVTGVWQPKKYTGTYGTNGFYLNFSDNSAATAAAIGKDNSGLGNNWTPNNISVTAGVTYDSMLDSPTQFGDGGNGRGNYAVMNPLDRNSSGTVADGNLKWSAGAAQVCVRGTFAIPSSGKWYMECVVGSASSSVVGVSFGLATADVSLTSSSGATGLYQLYASTNRQINLNNSTTGSISGGFSANDVLQIAVDVDNNKMWLGVNNTWYDSTYTANGNPTSGANATSTTSMVGLFPFSNVYSNNVNWNFGQRPFSYTPPTGFKALNTLNLPQPTILKGNQYFDIALYNNATVVSGLGFSPDLVWHKSRNQTYQHYLYDKVRGVGPKGLNSSSTAAEGTNDSLGIVSFDSSGVTYSSDAGLSQTNAVGWFWKEGATPGFDIVTYTGNATAGRTVSHSLGVAPVFIVTKRRDSTSNWWVYSKALNDTGSTGWLYLNLTSSRQTTADAADDPYFKTAPTSSVFSIAGDGINVNTATYVSYLFSEVAGFSRFGSYTGNGAADGPFVHCGFLPRWIMFKKTSATDDWVIYDTARDEYNVASKNLYANGTFIEDSNTTNRAADILSNGFKLRSSGTFLNGSGATFIFAAFAENPFKNALAR
jgi:hypothetical protein